MNKRTTIALCLILLAAYPFFAQADDTRPPLADRLLRLEQDLKTYRENYAKLEGLFLRTVAVTQGLLDSAGELAASVAGFIAETKELQTEVEGALADSERLIDYLKTKVYERPTLLLQADVSWHVLLGEAAGISLSWEPLPWLSLSAGAELWYTDTFRAAFPLTARFRFGLDVP